MEIILVAIAIAAMVYKVYLHERIDGERYAKTYALTGYITFRHLLPISKTKHPIDRQSAVTKANIALVIFWLCFVSTIVFVGIKNME